MKPILGILARRRPDPERPFAGQTHFFREITRAADQRGGETVVFDLHALHGATPGAPVPGLRYDLGADLWGPARVAAPLWLYDRCFFAPEERDEILSQREAVLRGRRAFNPPETSRLLGDKLAFSRCLSRHGIDTPETWPVSAMADSKRFDGLPASLVVKPRYGMKGRGVRFARVTPEGCFDFGDGNRLDVEALIRCHHDDLIQPYVPSLRVGRGAVVDVRALIQRVAGVWQVVGAYVRTGDPGQPLNLSRGAWIEPLGRHFAPELEARIRDQAVAVGQILEATAPGGFEMGVDFIVDRSERIWCLEANSKPARLGLRILAGDRTQPQEVRRRFADARRRSVDNIARFVWE